MSYVLMSLIPLQHTTLKTDRNPSPQRDSSSIPAKRAAADPRPTSLGHWDRQGFDPRTVQPVVSRYTDCAIPVRIG